MKNPNEIARLRQKLNRMRTLVEVNALISSSLDLDTMLENVITISKKVMNADASSLMRVDEKTRADGRREEESVEADQETVITGKVGR